MCRRLSSPKRCRIESLLKGKFCSRATRFARNQISQATFQQKAPNIVQSEPVFWRYLAEEEGNTAITAKTDLFFTSHVRV